MAHELGHVWDNHSGGNLSKGFDKEIHANYVKRLFGLDATKDWGNGPPAAGWDNKITLKQDVAESFAAYIYPGTAAIKSQRKGILYCLNAMGYCYTGFRDTPRGQYIESQLPKPWDYFYR